jgi:hypothetical protein
MSKSKNNKKGKSKSGRASKTKVKGAASMKKRMFKHQGR